MQVRRTEASSRPASASSAEAPVQTPNALQVTGLTRRFGRAVALDGIDLTVTAGQFMVLLGPSGSGKTTLLRLVAGIDRATTGSITIGTRIVAD
jgi:ABC-type Fe3+/spermidine/putrescine transport system ATPase subunit